MATVSQHQQASFASPIRGGSLDANIVRDNDNTIANTYNAHDADATIHVQSDTGLPAAGTVGRLFFTTADRRFSYDNGSAWQTLTVDGASVTSGTIPTARMAGSYTGITGLGTVSVGEWNATPIGIAKGGTGLTATPSNGQLPIGNGTGFTLGGLTAGSNVTITNGAGTVTIATVNSGDVTGPASSTATAVPRFSDTGGKTLVNSGVLVDASNNVTGVGALTAGSLVSNGTLNLSAAGAGQIRFPATQNASADANTLDDYEEGTYTLGPTGGFSLSGAGNYVKVGRAVTINADMTFGTNTDSNNAGCTGLPFSPQRATTLAVYSDKGTIVYARIPAGSTTVTFTNESGTPYTNSSFALKEVRISGTFITA